MAKPQVLFIGDLDKSLPEYQSFTEKFECIEYTITTKEQVIEDFKTKFQNIVAIYGAWLGFMPTGGFRNEVLEAAPASLKVISICSVGYDGYDGVAMRAKDMILTHVPSDGAAGPVADLVLYNALTSFRNFKMFEKSFLATNHTVVARANLASSDFNTTTGQIEQTRTIPYAFGEYFANRKVLSPQGHDVVIVGFGNIGQTIGARLSNIGMNIHYVKRTKLTDAEEKKLGYPVTYHSSIEAEGALNCDLVVIACPATPETKHLINKKVIDSFAKPFRIINIGRGSVIDEQALVDGLKADKILFAGLDVYEEEPKCHEELLTRDDVMLTPHIGASTADNFNYTTIVALKNIENVILEGGKGLDTVN
ncbi:putative 2-hydroxyacid dehydrogenase YPL113C [[Candida] anglica]